jgi:RNA polymerase sigma-70 factor, ECF subfamily
MGDAELVTRFRTTRDKAVFAELVRAHQSAVRGFLMRVTRGDHALADDLAQETFVDAWRRIDQFRNDGSFAGWLFSIAWRRFLMTSRKRKFEPLDGVEEQVLFSGADAKIDLERAMVKLSASERAALTLCGAFGHSQDEAAVILNFPLGTVKSLVSRGRQKLRVLLDMP